MQTLTDDDTVADQTVANIAGRHGFSREAGEQVLASLAAGGGRQAQFNHPELGGMGQWSQGGMTMIGDMFNTGLKTRVAALCNDLMGVFRDTPSPAAFGHRWPAGLGTPGATGSQNDSHYAIFPASRRLAIEQDGRITVYDIGDHRIGGVSQQQGDEQTLRFTSQTGVVRLADLKIVGNEPEADDTHPATVLADATKSHLPVPGTTSDDEIFSRLERLADLRSRDIITTEEFATMKAELLARL